MRSDYHLSVGIEEGDTDMAEQTVQMAVKSSLKGSAFSKAVDYARKYGRGYNAATKTWAIPAQWVENAQTRGLKVAK